MSSTPKWYCRQKTTSEPMFSEMVKLSNNLRTFTKILIITAKDISVCKEHDNILDDCEKIVDFYSKLKDKTKNKDVCSLTKKVKRSPYKALLMMKFNCLSEMNDRRFHQLMFVLKKTLTVLLRKSEESEDWFKVSLRIAGLYNKCCNVTCSNDKTADNRPASTSDNAPENTPPCRFNANICSNMYPPLLLPQKPIDFSYVLQHVSQNRLEKNSLNLLYRLLNTGEQDKWREKCESQGSSLEVSHILTLNMTGDGGQSTHDCRDGDFQLMQPELGGSVERSLRSNLTQAFLQKERHFIWELIMKINQFCPSIFGGSQETVDLTKFLLRGIRLILGYVGMILDHVILWWIDMPISCYSLTHIDSIRNWLYAQSVDDIPEPVYSTLRGVAETLTNFVSINLWDREIRLTLISQNERQSFHDPLVSKPTNVLGTPTGTVWLSMFSNLINLSNHYFPHNEIENLSLVPVAEQIPILHRLDHSVHSMRLWVKEQAKLLCNTWRIEKFFCILERDVISCLELFTTIKLPKLSADISDVLMLVVCALRSKLICEINVNIDKMKKTSDECVQIMSVVCRTLSLANFKLCFPPVKYWQQKSAPQKVVDRVEGSQYVDFVLEAIYLPAIKATQDIHILKLVLKIICEAWLDHIYQQRIKFSVSGACRLLADFENVRAWLARCEKLQVHPDNLNMLSNHEVLRMCKGVGKILLRKPEDVIMIKQSPKYNKKAADDEAARETHLPSEMFVSNQKHWLQLRAGGTSFPCLHLCCGDTAL